MREYLPILLTLALTAAVVFIVFVLGRSIFDARRHRRENLEEETDSLITAGPLAEPKTRFSRFDRDFDQAIGETGLGITSAHALGFMALGAVLLGGIPLLLRNDYLLAAIGVVVGIMIPWAFFMIQRVRYRWRVQSQLPDAFYLMARSLRAGQNLEQSMATVANYGTQPLAGEFRRVVDQMELGLSPPAALQGMAKRLNQPDFDTFVTAVTLHRTMGGNLALLLEKVANSTRDRTQFRGYFRAQTALARITGFAIAAAPILLLIGYAIWQPDFIDRFTSSVTGIRMLVVAAILEVIGIIWMISLLRVEY